MNIMTKLAFRQMKLNKRRTVVTVLGVIISVAMITAVSTFGGSFLEMFQRTAIMNSGDWHVAFRSAPASELPTIRKELDAEGMILAKEEGLCQLADTKSGKGYLAVFKVNEDGLSPAQIQLKEGRLPEKEDEILVSHVLADYDVEGFQVGDRVTLNLGSRYKLLDGQRTPCSFEEYYEEGKESFSPIASKTYTVVGTAVMGMFEKSWYGSFFAITPLDEQSLLPSDRLDAYAKLKQVDGGIYDEAEALLSRTDAAAVDFNKDLLFYMGYGSDDAIMMTLYMISAILILIIMIGSIALIYNAFAISISERSRQFGMLASVGATNRQKRNAVLAEALVVSCLAIPPGIVFGLLGIGITFRIVSPMLVSFTGDESAGLSLVVLPQALIGAVLVSLVTIFLSAYLPAGRAAKIPPMEAIRTARDIKLTGKKVRTSRLSEKIFGFEAQLALKNLKRNKKRYWVTLFSLIVSLVLFLSACSFTYYLKNAYAMTEEETDCDVMVIVYDNEGNGSKRGFLEEVSQMDGVTGFYGRLVAPLESVDAGSTGLSEEVKELYREKTGAELDLKKQPLNGYLYGLDDGTLKDFARRAGVDSSALYDIENPKVIVVGDFTYQENYRYQDMSLFETKPGFLTLTRFSVTNHESQRTDRTSKESRSVDVQVVANTGETPGGGARKASWDFLTVPVYTSLDVFLNIAGERGGGVQLELFLNAPEPAALEQSIHELMEQDAYSDFNFYTQNIAQIKKENAQQSLVINIFVFGFITLISLISLANIFNTVSTGLALRRREFAMLKSVGMSPASFRRMIRFESLFYGGKAVLYGLPAGFLVMFAMYMVLKRNFSTGFTVPWGGVIAGILLIFLMVGLTMFYAGRKLKEEHIVESLRDDLI